MNGQSRSFQASWFERYNGFVYSESEDGATAFFTKCDSKVKQLGSLLAGHSGTLISQVNYYMTTLMIQASQEGKSTINMQC